MELKEIRRATGLSISAAFKEGLRALQSEVTTKATRIPYDIYRELGLGAGGYAIAASTDTRRGMQEILKRKHRR